jgi:putative membrane protein
LKTTIYIGGLFGLALLVGLLLHADLAGMLHALRLGGARILWLIPYRGLFFLLYALAWSVLLRPYDPQRRLTLSYLWWAATVREGIDRLLPVASVGGGLAGVRLLGWRGIGTSAAAATVIVEVFLTLLALWLFTIIGLTLLAGISHPSTRLGKLMLCALAGLALPVFLGLTLRYGSLFARLESALSRLTGLRTLAGGAAALDAEVRTSLRRVPQVLVCLLLQLLAMLSGSFEVWFALRLFGHPVDFRVATIMESLTQAARHLAFLIPGGLGVQEVSLILLGSTLGVGAELALAVSLAKRLREIVCGIPALVSWQWVEGRRLRGTAQQPR